MGTTSQHTYTAQQSRADDPIAAPASAAAPTDDENLAEPATQKKRGLFGRGWRKMTWALIAWSTLVLVGGLIASGNTDRRLTSACQNSLGDGSLCQQVGSQNAVNQFEHILKIGLVGFAILAVIWFMTRPQPRR